MEPCSATSARGHPWVKAWAALRTAIVHNRHVIPHAGERDPNGEAIATGGVESTGNAVVRTRCGQKQPRQWSKEGAPLLFQPRVRMLNGELGSLCKRWYPDLHIEAEERPRAA